MFELKTALDDTNSCEQSNLTFDTRCVLEPADNQSGSREEKRLPVVGEESHAIKKMSLDMAGWTIIMYLTIRVPVVYSWGCTKQWSKISSLESPWQYLQWYKQMKKLLLNALSFKLGVKTFVLQFFWDYSSLKFLLPFCIEIKQNGRWGSPRETSTLLIMDSLFQIGFTVY